MTHVFKNNLKNTIPDTEHKQRSLDIIKRIEGGEQTRETMTELFFLYNDRLMPRETSMSCAGCRKRVFAKLKKFYDIS